MRRLTPTKLEKLEDSISSDKSRGESSVFGICGDDRLPIKFLRQVRVPHGDGYKVDAIECDGPADILIPARLERLLYYKRRKIVVGGRGSSKTRSVVSILVERARAWDERILCLREIMKSLDESSYQEIRDSVSRRGLDSEFKLTDSKVRNLSSGATFGFEGMFRNQTALKGWSGASVAWVDEAENVSRYSWDILDPTIRQPGSEILITFNPAKEHDATWKDYVAPFVDKMVDGIYEDDENLIIECNWRHNPWLTDELKLEKDRMARLDPDRYMWIWEGKFKRASNEQVFNGKWRVAEFESNRHWDGPYFGADFGFSQDPSTLVKCWIHEGRLWVEYEAYKQGVELDHMAEFYDAVPQSRDYKIRADCARPETISHLARRGFSIEGADKWTGSVEDGIAYLRSFEEIVIHPRCVNTMQEMAMYAYKVDRNTGDILPDVVDKWNHAIDAIRYAMAPMIKKGGVIGLWERLGNG